MSALTDRDANAQPTSNLASNSKQQIAGGDENRKMQENAQQSMGQKFTINESTTYISPSDSILSPATQKLAGFKQKHMNKQAGNRAPAARTLFARTQSSCSSGGFDDLRAEGDKA